MIFNEIINVLKWMIIILVGFSSGGLVAGGIFAYISMIGIIPRLAMKTKSAESITIYESAVIWGGSLGSAVYIFNWGIDFGDFFGTVWGILYGLGAGIFVGCLAMALAEVLRSFPILTMRIKLRWGIPIIAFFLALGKMLGSMYCLIKDV